MSAGDIPEREAIGKIKPRVLLIAPVGEGVGGMICQNNALVRELKQQEWVELKVIDSAQRYRDYHDNAFLSRAWGGGVQAAKRFVELARALTSFKPQSVQIKSSASLGLIRDVVLVALVRLFGAKTFVSFHFGRIPQLAVQRNWEWRLLSWVVRMSNGVQVLDCRSLMVLQRYFPNCQIRQFPNGVDFAWIDTICGRVNAGKLRSPIIKVVFVGMAIPTKGVTELVEACSKITDLDFELEMVGPVGPEMRDQLCGVAARLNNGKWLKFSGALSREEAVGRIASADLFVLPSYTEGFPGAVLEAMACSVAIVSTNVGAIPEMLMGDDGEPAGLIVPPRDTQRLKLAMEELLTNPAKRIQLGVAARRKAEANYRLSDLARRWAELWACHGRLTMI